MEINHPVIPRLKEMFYPRHQLAPQLFDVVNLLPHDVKVKLPDDSIISFPASGRTLRQTQSKQKRLLLYLPGGIPVYAAAKSVEVGWVVMPWENVIVAPRHVKPLMRMGHFGMILTQDTDPKTTQMNGWTVQSVGGLLWHNHPTLDEPLNIVDQRSDHVE